jgi:hypothetical protein
MHRAVYLYRLQQLDREKEQIENRLQQLERALGETPALRRARQDVQKTADTVRRITTRQHDLDLQVKGLKEKIAESESRLYDGSIRNPKVLSDRQAELASLRRRLEQAEEKLLESMIALDEAESAAQETQENLQAVEDAWSVNQKSLLEEKETLNLKAQELHAAREELLPSIPAADLQHYRNVREMKGEQVVAIVRGETCTGCWMEVPQFRLGMARGEELVTCDNCERILLLEKYL